MKICQIVESTKKKFDELDHDTKLKIAQKTAAVKSLFSLDNKESFKKVGINFISELAEQGDWDSLYQCMENLLGFATGNKEPIDTSTTGMPLYDDMLADPKYFREKKGVDFEIVYMRPAEYLRKSESGFDDVGHTGSFAAESDLVQEYAKRMALGSKAPMPTLVYSPDNFTQEGRHRAEAAKLLKISQIPVMVVKKSR